MSAPKPVLLQSGARSAKDVAPVELGDMMRFSKLLLDRYGLHFSSNRRTELEYGIRHAFASSSCASLDEFYNLLVSAQNGSVEMDLLVNAVTVSETHFFRDAAQFNALATVILPGIVKRKTSLRTLRIWSAGCASGEEPYSIAMLLQDVLPDIESWSITILATDINTTSLERARVASYGQWAFREDRALSMRMRHFRPVNNRFELSSHIRRMVTFSQLNLMEDHYPSFETNTMMMDLVICRNVTIYFPQDVTKQVVGRFHTSLVDGGWLVVGHSEPSLEIYNQFQPRNFPDTVVYQRDDNAKPKTAPFVFAPTQEARVPPGRSATEASPTRPVVIPRVNPQPLSAPAPSAKEESAQNLAHARELLEFGHDQDALSILDKLVETEPKNPQVYTLLGQVYANRGAWVGAEKNCRRAIEIDKLALEAYYTLGLVLQHQARLAEAIDMMKKVVYLDRNHVLGHYHLAGLYREQGLVPNAQKSLENALNLLRNAPADEMIAGSGGVTVSRLRDAIIHQQQTLNKVS
jgi:chemotaxis protein methyltransferase CheR